MRWLLGLTILVQLGAQTAIRVRVGGATMTMPLEPYVAAVLAGESSVFRSDDALKAMAVAARSYAVRQRGRHASEGFDFCATTHCQRMEPDAITARLESIAGQTSGELLWFEGKAAFTPYTRDCGGRTEDAAAVWPDETAPYLRSREDQHAVSTWQWSGDPARLAEALRRSRLQTPKRVERISIGSRTDSGRAQTLLLAGGGETVRISASSFRFAVGRELGWNTVLSDRYEIRGGTVFEGRGAGHGVGLCQRGADQMGRAGRPYREILAYYYPGTTVGLTGRGLSWHRLGGDSIALYSTQPDQDRSVLEIAEREARAVSNRNKLTMPRDVEIRIYPTVEVFRNVTGEPGWVAGYTTGRRIHLQPAAVLRSRSVLEQILRHEFLHVLVEAHAAPGLPAWFREGLVEYLSGARTNAASAAPSDSALRQTGDEARARRAYAEAAGRVAGLVKRYGATVVLEWLKTGLPADVRNASNREEPTKSK